MGPLLLIIEITNGTASTDAPEQHPPLAVDLPELPVGSGPTLGVS